LSQARLSQAAIDILAIVAYQQPLTAEQISTVRGKAGGHVLSQLVHRGLRDVVAGGQHHVLDSNAQTPGDGSGQIDVEAAQLLARAFGKRREVLVHRHTQTARCFDCGERSCVYH